MHTVPEPSPPRAAEKIGDVAVASNGHGQTPVLIAAQKREREPFGRFRRNLDRIRSGADPNGSQEASEDDPGLRLEVMLLREENARLKASRHRPADVGTLIDQLRSVALQSGDEEMLDEAWSLLSECLVIREGLEQACLEIQGAIGAVHQRLQNLSICIAELTPGTVAPLDAVAQSSVPS